MLTIQSFISLMKLKFMKTDIIEVMSRDNDKRCFISSEDFRKYQGTNLFHDKVVKIQSFEISNLINEGYVEKSSGTIQITYKGRHLFQITLYSLLGLLFKSVFIPIVVAFVTAYLTTKYFS